MDSLFVVDEAATPGSGGKTSFPDFPGEAPTKLEIVTFIETWTDDLNSTGFSAPLRNQLPFELAKLKRRDLLTVPADPALAASVNAENARIAHQNELNKTELESRLHEIQNRLAAKLSRAMRSKAPLLLAKILKEWGSRR